MMQERGVEVDHSSLNRWVLKYTPALDKTFRQRKRAVELGPFEWTGKLFNYAAICSSFL